LDWFGAVGVDGLLNGYKALFCFTGIAGTFAGCGGVCGLGFDGAIVFNPNETLVSLLFGLPSGLQPQFALLLQSSLVSQATP
jgi:hypothetical protein